MNIVSKSLIKRGLLTSQLRQHNYSKYSQRKKKKKKKATAMKFLLAYSALSLILGSTLGLPAPESLEDSKVDFHEVEKRAVNSGKYHHYQ